MSIKFSNSHLLCWILSSLLSIKSFRIACLSTLPFEVHGISSINCKKNGIIYWGKYRFNASRTLFSSFFSSSFGTITATNFGSLFQSTVVTQQFFPEQQSIIAFSISPVSILCPEIFIWESLRPKNSISPFLKYLPKSPVLYIRLLFNQKKLLCVLETSPKYSFANPFPVIYSSPCTISGHGFIFASSTSKPWLLKGTPYGMLLLYDSPILHSW